MTAAALAAGVISSQAQGTVYSQNVVGYANVTIPANSFSLVANQLDLGQGSNAVNNVLTTGFLGAGSGAAQSVLDIWNGATFSSFFYYNSSDVAGSGLPPGWYDASGNPCTNNFGPSVAAFVDNPGSSSITTTLTGQVDQGTNSWTTVKTGLNFYSEPVPLAGTPLDSTNVNFPATGPDVGPGGEQDTYQAWTGSGYGATLFYYDATTAGGFGLPAGWYDASGNYQDTNAVVWPNVGSGFLVQHVGANSNWVSTFQVQ